MDLRIAGIVEESIVDGPGIRYVIFTQGCTHDCPGCHNLESHPMEGGITITHDQILQEIKSNSLLSGVTFSGGEPTLQLESVLTLALRIKAETGLNIYLYSGFTVEQLMRNPKAKELIETIDVLIDGPYIEELRDPLELKFKGSSNQRTIDTKKYLAGEEDYLRER